MWLPSVGGYSPSVAPSSVQPEASNASYSSSVISRTSSSIWIFGRVMVYFLYPYTVIVPPVIVPLDAVIVKDVYEVASLR